MFRAVVYDDGFQSRAIEEFTSANELEVVRQAQARVKELRSGRNDAIGHYTMRLEKVRESK